MKHFIILFFYSFQVICQIDISTIKIPKSLNETSGLEFFENYLITHNDSGDKPRLYIINKLGKKILEIEISQIKNKDWEDIASDENHFYIADTGNNFATRENLRIYILNKNLIKLIPSAKKFDTTDLINEARNSQKKIGIYKISNKSWKDIGNCLLYTSPSPRD